MAHPVVATTERFWDRVDRSGDCWPWTGPEKKKGTGYGSCHIHGQKERATHRLAYLLTYGDIPEGKLVCHRCDNPSCCNPQHLFLGSPGDNMADKMAKGRHRTLIANTRKGADHGMVKLTEDDVRAIRQRYAAGEGTMYDLAEDFKVSQAAVWRIVRRKAWTHLE